MATKGVLCNEEGYKRAQKLGQLGLFSGVRDFVDNFHTNNLVLLQEIEVIE